MLKYNSNHSISNIWIWEIQMFEINQYKLNIISPTLMILVRRNIASNLWTSKMISVFKIFN